MKINADGCCTVIGRWPRHSGRHSPDRKDSHGRSRLLDARRRRKFEHDDNSPTKPPAACTASAHRSSTSSPNGWKSKSPATAAVHHMEFERGKKTCDLKVIGKTTKTGTKVTFKPDPTLFPDIEFRLRNAC